jgi:2-polyprenyl-3-methyl-5-hydroxy-6-metoxy-1,4-benzoquinol methylase
VRRIEAHFGKIAARLTRRTLGLSSRNNATRKFKSIGYSVVIIMDGNLPSDSENEDPVINRNEFVGKDVIEIGCGAGAFTLEYLTQANSILGIDKDGEAIDSLKAEWFKQFQDDRGDFRLGDVVDFPLPKETFDIAVFSDSF